MRPRSIVFDLFDGYVSQHGGEVGLRPLTELLGSFGVAEDTVRVVMSRLRREGAFTTRRIGRASIYTLTDATAKVLAEQREQVLARPGGRWDGQWRLVIYSVPESNRPGRERVRRTLTEMGFGPLAPSTWVSPHDRLKEVDATLAGGTVSRLELLTAKSGDGERDREMAARCWDMKGLNKEYDAFLRKWEKRLATFAKRKRADDEAALVARVELLSDYRPLPLRDPNLPDQLLPSKWSGQHAREVFDNGMELYRPAAVRHYNKVTGEKLK